MVLSGSQHLLLALALALCACFLLPRMFGGGVRNTGKQDPRKMPAARGSQGNRHSSRTTSQKNNHFDQIRSEMEKQLKTEKTGSGHSTAFTLMPIYAIGVALFAAYKFSKVKSNEKITSKSSQDDKKKTKATETQLLELEKHLAQTETMLNSLLTQLNPLSNCVNSLATEQKDEIMNQLKSIRQLMKKSVIDQPTFNNSVNQANEDTLEKLINSFKNPQISESDKENDISKLAEENLDLSAQNKPVPEEPGMSHCREENSSLLDDEHDVTPGHTADGLRKRNVKD